MQVTIFDPADMKLINHGGTRSTVIGAGLSIPTEWLRKKSTRVLYIFDPAEK